jgi:hypothetical protein
VAIQLVATITLTSISQLFSELARRANHIKVLANNRLIWTACQVFADDNGPFGSPTSDSERAMITLSTRKRLMVVITFSGSEHLQFYAFYPREVVHSHECLYTKSQRKVRALCAMMRIMDCHQPIGLGWCRCGNLGNATGRRPLRQTGHKVKKLTQPSLWFVP